MSKDEIKELLSEQTVSILEAVDEKNRLLEQKIIASFEIFTDEVRGLLKDVNTSK